MVTFGWSSQHAPRALVRNCLRCDERQYCKDGDPAKVGRPTPERMYWPAKKQVNSNC
jgi:hypothetical protein